MSRVSTSLMSGRRRSAVDKVRNWLREPKCGDDCCRAVYMESMLRPSVTWDKIVSTSMVWLNGDDLASIRRCMDSSGPFREEQF